MLLLTCGDKSLLYTGDFRANGRKSFPALLRRLPPVDALITEGTTLSRTGAAPVTEQEMEQTACCALQSTDAPAFICMAATNLDRCVTAYKAARRSDRVQLQDVYMASIAEAAGGSIPRPQAFAGVRVFLTASSQKQVDLLHRWPNAKIGRSGIAGEKFLMCVRPSMTRYLEKLDEICPFTGGVLFYSMWSGYREKTDMAAFLQFMESKGVTVTDLHTSGHADPDTIRALIKDVQPRCIIPVHTENAAWFAQHTDRTVVHSDTFEV